jgi:hypothetical protein
MKWRLYGAWEGRPATVWPLNDLREHDPDDQACWCRPRWDGGVLVHNAMDRREEYEEGRRLS